MKKLFATDLQVSSSSGDCAIAFAGGAVALNEKKPDQNDDGDGYDIGFEEVGGNLEAFHGAFLREWGFTAELLEAAMPIVLERAAARLGDKLSTGAVKI